jgi:hypothetical protein
MNRSFAGSEGNENGFYCVEKERFVASAMEDGRLPACIGTEALQIQWWPGRTGLTDLSDKKSPVYILYFSDRILIFVTVNKMWKDLSSLQPQEKMLNKHSFLCFRMVLLISTIIND